LFYTSHRTLIILAGLVWYLGSLVLYLKSADLLQEALILKPGFHKIIAYAAAGISIGIIKALFIFNRSCRKNLKRIREIANPRLWQFFRPWFFFFLALMILLGVSLSRLALGDPRILIPLAVLELSIATALLISSRCFWRS